MNDYIEFIGRETEIKTILSTFSEWDTNNLVFVRGKGGIGKTRLLQEIQERSKTHRISSSPKETLTFALVQEFTDSEWSQEFLEGVRKTAAIFQAKLIETDAKFNIDQMASDLHQIIKQKPDVIIVSLGTSNKVKSQIKAALRQGIKVITFDNTLSEIQGLSSRIEQDDTDGARLLTKEMLDELNYQGKVAVLWANGHPKQLRRYNVLIDQVSKYPEISIVDVQCKMGTQSEELTKKTVEQLIKKHPDTKALWVTYNEFARGATKTLAKLNRNDISIYGFDLCPSDIRLMNTSKNSWKFTAAVSPQSSGEIVVRLAVMAASNKEIKKNYLLPMQIVKQGEFRNIAAFNEKWSGNKIGWSNWLRTLQASNRSKDGNPLFAAEIFDFDDSSLSVYGNIELAILASTIKEKNPYYGDVLDEFRHYRNLEVGGGGTGLSQQKDRIAQAIADAMNFESNNRRIILLFDTIEKARLETLTQLGKIITKLNNTICIFAGRPENTENWKLLNSIAKGRKINIKLNHFTEKESSNYLDRKKAITKIFLSKKETKQLITLARGYPILLDLAVDFVSREISIENILNLKSGNSPRNIDDDQFKKNLVGNVLQISRPLDRLILTLSHVYPLNIKMISEIIDVDINEAKTLFKSALNFAFVKKLPGDLGISLHDEMRDMIKKYLLVENRNFDKRKKRDSQIAALIYKNQEENLYREIKKIEDRMGKKNSSDTSTSPMYAFKTEKLKRMREYATEKQLEHLFYAGENNFFDTWKAIMNRVRRSKKVTFINNLIQIAKENQVKLTNEQKLDLQYFEARFLSDINNIDAALKMAKDLLSTKYNKSTIYNLLGVIFRKKGDLKEAEKAQLKCLNGISLYNYFARANVLNQLGYIARLLGDYKKAEKYYKQSQASLSKINIKKQSTDDQKKVIKLMASLSNNLGYVYGLRKEFDVAKALCQEAVSRWKEIQDYVEISRAETTMGILARDQGDNEASCRLLTTAIDRMKEPAYAEELCRAYFHLGWSQWYLAELDPGDESDIRDVKWDIKKLRLSLVAFEKSKDIATNYGFTAELPGILHQTASIIWHIGHTTKSKKLQLNARTLNQDAINISYEVNDTRYAIDAILGDAEWDYEIRQFKHINKYAKLLYRDFGNVQGKYKLYFGRLKRIQGDIALSKNNYKEAFKKYSEAFTLINEQQGFGRYSIQRELRRLRGKLLVLVPTDAIKWINYLKKQWEKAERNHLLINWCDQQLAYANLIMNTRIG